MTRETVTIDGEQYLIDTEAMEVERAYTEVEALRAFCDRHIGVVGFSSSGNRHKEYDYILDLSTNPTPGSGNIGTTRTEAEEELIERGYEVRIVFVEPSPPHDDAEAKIGVTLDEVED